MAVAKSLSDLRKVRTHFRHHYETSDNVIGSMLGVESKNGQHVQPKKPAIVYVVHEKYDKKWLRESDFIPKTLKTPDGLECATDVVESPYQEWFDVPRGESLLAGKLRGQHPKITVGSQIAFMSGEGASFGTLSVFAESRGDKTLGFLTNAHVADRPGNRLYHPMLGGVYLGSAPKMSRTESVQNWYGDYAGSGWWQPEYINSHVETDCAFVYLGPRWLDKPGTHLDARIFTDDSAKKKETLGAFQPVDDDSMDLIGMKVRRLGRTTGLRRGMIEGFMYGTLGNDGETAYSDLVIRGEVDNNGESIPFSTYGDSGSMVVSDASPHRPIAIMSAGNQLRMRNGTLHEDWTFATAIEPILDHFDIDLITNFP